MSQTRINLCKESSDYLEDLFNRFKTKSSIVQIGTFYKIAFAIGIINLTKNCNKQDSKGKEIRIDSFETALFDAVIRQKLHISTLNQRGTYYKNAIDLGAMILKEEDEGNEFQLLIKIIKDSMKFSIGDNRELGINTMNNNGNEVSHLNIILGADKNNNKIEITWNDKNNSGQHIGICGKTGSGKTQLMLELVSQISEKSNNISVIAFDYSKGDIAANEEFSKLIGARVIDIAESGIPFNPFYLEEINDCKIEELKEIFASIQKGLGPKQTLALFDILKEAYHTNENVDLECVYNSIRNAYKKQNKSDDILVELFHKLVVPKIFPSANNDEELTDLLGNNLIFDLHNINSNMKVKELVTFLILNKIYTEVIRLPDSRIDSVTGAREIRAIIIIDEAHNYLDCENRILEKMLRELRSKGVAIMLITQGYKDFNQKSFDYSSMLNWTFIMKSDNSIQDIEKALAVKKECARNLVSEIALAETGTVYSRIMRNVDKEYTVFNSKLFWKRFF